MMNSCANPSCSKPLHYLREGRIFVFDVEGTDKLQHHLEHYWLCGACAETFQLEKTGDRGVRLTPRKSFRPARVKAQAVSTVLAS